jgi:hypothetical protein
MTRRVASEQISIKSSRDLERGQIERSFWLEVMDAERGVFAQGMRPLNR